jgi:hypothetical protein
VLLELAARDYLNELMLRSPASRAAIEEDVRPWDERFRAATVQEKKPHLPPPGRRFRLVAIPHPAAVAQTSIGGAQPALELRRHLSTLAQARALIAESGTGVPRPT